MSKPIECPHLNVVLSGVEGEEGWIEIHWLCSDCGEQFHDETFTRLVCRPETMHLTGYRAGLREAIGELNARGANPDDIEALERLLGDTEEPWPPPVSRWQA